ncbi:DUF1801 domain-containing protein [Maribacter sp. R86514]|uniref:DUF1801 domain-containing protein n=1 Tax=Maribacter sp. R86514 TaxID=3093854 RepID=UPI0037C5983D
MKYKANTPDEYIAQLPLERKEVIEKIRGIILQNLPNGFEEQLSYGMLGYVVPHSLYPAGYHVQAELPLPFINLASQKNFIALYHSGIYADPALMNWFKNEYPIHCKRKLDMGKSCVRFKSMDDIPYKLIAELCTKMTPQEWISLYENNIKK